MRTRTLLVTTLLAATVLPLGLVTYLNHRSESEAAAAAHDRQTAAVAEDAARDIGARIESLLDSARADATLPQFRDRLAGAGDAVSLGRVLAVVALREPLNVASVALLDAKGRNVADTVAARVGTDESRAEYVTRVAALGYPQFVGPAENPWHGGRSFFLAAPVNDADGRRVGLLRLEIQPALLAQVLRDSLSGHPDLRAVLLDADGRVESTTDSSLAAGTVIQPGIAGHSADFGIGGVAQRGISVAISHALKRVLVFEPRAQFDAPLRAQLIDWLVSQVLLVLLVLVAVWFVAGRLSRPAVRLAEAADRIAAGDATREVEVTGSEEMQRLGRAFITMNRQLQSHLAELRELNADLERRVAERTAELAAATTHALAASSAKSAFLANISHEIRTPLNAVIGLTSLMRDAPLDRLQAERLAKVHDAAEHLMAILNDVLDISKIEAGKLEVVREPFALDLVVRHVVDLMAPRAQAKGLALEVSLPTEPAWVSGDRLRLQQVLLNLVSNAVKFTERGRVSVTVTACAPAGVGLRFEVRDTGIGVDGAARERLFGAFEQADASVSRQYGGTGLGLAISRRLVTLLGGSIGHLQPDGGGSLFWFELPLPATLPQPPDQPAPVTSAAATIRGRRVLVVDDNEVNLEIASASLGVLGLAVDVAHDGVRAVEMARAVAYDAILMDLQMPRMDGLEATRVIRALAWHNHTPIIAMTANAFDEDRVRCQEAGMDDHIGKPMEAQTLRATMHRWLAAGESPAQRSAM